MPVSALIAAISAITPATSFIYTMKSWPEARSARPTPVTLTVGDTTLTVDSTLTDSELEKAVRGLLEAGSAREPGSADE
jgi:hypothetical protein